MALRVDALNMEQQADPLRSIFQVPATFGEGFGAAFHNTALDFFIADEIMSHSILSGVLDSLKEQGIEDTDHIAGINEVPPDQMLMLDKLFETGDLIEANGHVQAQTNLGADYLADRRGVLQGMAELRRLKRTGFDVPSVPELVADIKGSMIEMREQNNRTLQRAGGFSSGLGVFTAAVLDPALIPTYFIGGPLLRTVGAGAKTLRARTLRQALATAGLEGSAEALSVNAAFQMRDFLNIPSDDINPALRIGAAATFGLAGGGFAGRLMDRASGLTRYNVENVQQMVQQFRKGLDDGLIATTDENLEALHTLEEFVELGGRAPKGVDQLPHLQAMLKADMDAAAMLPMRVDEILGDIDIGVPSKPLHTPKLRQRYTEVMDRLKQTEGGTLQAIRLLRQTLDMGPTIKIGDFKRILTEAEELAEKHKPRTPEELKNVKPRPAQQVLDEGVESPARPTAQDKAGKLRERRAESGELAALDEMLDEAANKDLRVVVPQLTGKPIARKAIDAVNQVDKQIEALEQAKVADTALEQVKGLPQSFKQSILDDMETIAARLMDEGVPEAEARGMARAQAMNRASEGLAKLRRDTVRTINTQLRLHKWITGDGTITDAGQRAERIMALLSVDPKLEVRPQVPTVNGVSRALLTPWVGRVAEALGERFELKILSGRVNMDNTFSRDLFREMRGINTGNAEARSIGNKLSEVLEDATGTYNALGGNVRFLKDWGMPQVIDPRRVLELIRRHRGLLRRTPEGDAVSAAFREFEADLLPQLDLERMGLNLDQARQALREAFDNARMGTVMPEDVRIGSAYYDRLEQSRFLHFRQTDEGAEAAFNVMEKYGRGDPLETIVTHLENLARAAAFRKALGSNPDEAKEFFAQMIQQGTGDGKGIRGTLGGFIAGNPTDVIKAAIDETAGAIDPMAYTTVARTFQALRNLATASRLGSAFISAFFGDAAFAQQAVRRSGLSSTRLMREYTRQLRQSGKRHALQQYLIGENFLRSLQDSFRMTDVTAEGITGRMASFTVRLTGLSGHTNSLRGAMQMTTLFEMGNQLKRAPTLSKVDRAFREALIQHGFTEDDWKALRGVKLSSVDGDELMLMQDLTHSGLALEQRTDLAGKIYDMLDSLANDAVPEPDLRMRAAVRAGLRRGSIAQESVRSFFQFKSFSLFVTMRHFHRSRAGFPGALRYWSPLVLRSTIGGYLAWSAKQLLNGNDPKPLTDPATFVASVVQGGTFGYAADLISSNLKAAERGQRAAGRGGFGLVLGPSGQLLGDLFELTVLGPGRAAFGHDTHMSVDAVRFLSRWAPFLPSAWYGRLLADRWLARPLEEAADPFEARRRRLLRERRLLVDYGVEPWWPVDEPFPRRAPLNQR